MTVHSAACNGRDISTAGRRCVAAAKGSNFAMPAHWQNLAGSRATGVLELRQTNHTGSTFVLDCGS